MVERFPCEDSEPLKLPRPPARASEAFLSTIAQGMWAEEKLIEAINSTGKLIAIRYGQSRYNGELISSKELWKKYIEKIYTQMSIYGKRPDLLIFKKEDIHDLNVPEDISEEDEEDVKELVFKAIAGIECRSSSYFYDKYIKARDKEDKELSITVKEEDLERLNKWRKTYCGSKPLYYVQLFFDKGFYISYDHVLKLINLRRRGTRIRHLRLETDRTTQKRTYFIGMSHAKIGLIAINSPELTCKTIESWDGKIYAIRMPKGGKYKLTDEFIEELLSL